MKDAIAPPPSPVPRIRVLLVDDEPLATRRLRELLASYPGFDVVASATNVAEARRLIEASAGARGGGAPIDVVFLDIEMPGENGLELLASVPRATVVVFVTAYPQYALDAFGVGALDYLLKPIDAERFDHTISRVRQMMALLRASGGDDDGDELDDPLSGTDSEPGQLPSPRRSLPGETIGLPLATGRGEQRVALDHICWIEALRNYSWLQLREPQRKLLMRRKLNYWQAELPSDRFVRLGKSLLVNVTLVTQLEWVSRDQILLTFPGRSDQLAVGRLAASRLREVLGTTIPGQQREGPAPE